VRGVYAVHILLARHWISAVKDLFLVPTFTAGSSCKTSETLTEHSDSQQDFRPRRKIPNEILQSLARGVYTVHTLLAKHWISAVKDRSACDADIHCWLNLQDIRSTNRDY
jgi:hypothetical protein